MPNTLRLTDTSDAASTEETSATSLRLTAAPLVLHVRVVAGSGGGPDKTILHSAPYAAASGLRMAAAYIHPAGDTGINLLQQRALALGCDFHAIPEHGPLDPATVRSLLALCRRLRVAIWHGHDYKSNVLGLLLRRWHPMRLITTVHGWTFDTARTRFYYHLDNLCLSRYSHVITVSRALREHCVNLGVPENRLSYIPNGIDLESYRPTGRRESLRRLHGMASDETAIGVVGRLSTEKGIDRAIDTLARLRQHGSHRSTTLHLIGDGPDRARLQGMVQGLGLSDAVRFHGWQSDPRPFYESLDLMLLPSRTEGLPNTVLEAMAMGLPVAATEVGDVREVLADGRCGLLLDGDETRWPLRLAALLADDEGLAAMARRARQRIAAHYTFARRVELETLAYEHLLGTPLRTGLRRAA